MTIQNTQNNSLNTTMRFKKSKHEMPSSLKVKAFGLNINPEQNKVKAQTK